MYLNFSKKEEKYMFRSIVSGLLGVLVVQTHAIKSFIALLKDEGFKFSLLNTECDKCQATWMVRRREETIISQKITAMALNAGEKAPLWARHKSTER